MKCWLVFCVLDVIEGICRDDRERVAKYSRAARTSGEDNLGRWWKVTNVDGMNQ